METYTIEENTLLKTFTTSNYLIVNRIFISLFGLENAVFLSNLIDKYFFFYENNKLKEDFWFYCIYTDQTQQTGLTLAKLRKCKKYFIDEKIISTKWLENPAKEHYKINIERLLSRINTSPIKTRRASPIKTRRAIYNTKVLYNIKTNTYIRSIDFDKFWKLYPKKEKKAQALSAWEKLCTLKSKEQHRPTLKQVAMAIRLQKTSERWQNPEYIPLPSTWINNYRWLEKPEEMKNFNKTINQEFTDNRPDYIKK